jgi:hypothetical protein
MEMHGFLGTDGWIYVSYVGFEVFTAGDMKRSIFWNITPYSPFKVNRRFGGTCRPHLLSWLIFGI